MLNAEKLTGTVLSDRYEVLDKIGTGGMAMVYKAHDRVLDRDVAIKILRESYEENSEIVSNFIKEARSSASLVHPNVVSVYDVCEYEGISYMVMELVDGKTLKKYIMNHPRLPWQEACDYAIQIGQGIQAAHERGIIHRDIKPQNIIMAPGGVLKVTDFGIAKAMESDTSVAGGTATGSVHYISPEQAKGGYTDFRSDIYSLGICLYEMLAGRVPFDGDSPVSVALMHIEEEPVNVKCVNMDVPSDLAYVTMKAMSRDPGKRYQKMQDFLEDLRAVLADENLPSKETPKKNIEQGGGSSVSSEKTNTSKVTHSDLTNRGRQTRMKSNDRKKAKRRREERNSIILAVSTVAVLLLIAMGVIMIMVNPFNNTVPNVTNMTVDEARAELSKNGYTLDEAMEYSLSDTVDIDRIISQSPEGGKESPKNEPIKIVISLGASGGGIPVADVTHMDVDKAGKTIEEQALRYKIVSEYSDSIQYGYIIRQTPMAGTHINAGDYVTLHMSMGPKTSNEQKSKVSVPNLIGMYQDAADGVLVSANLTMGTVSRMPSTSPEGTIIRQSPSASTSVEESTAVSIVISSGNPSSTLDNNFEYVPNDEPEQIDTPIQGIEPDTDQDSGEVYEEEPVINEEPVVDDTSQTSGSTLFTVRIPDGADDEVNVRIVVDGNVVHDAIHSKTEGAVTQEISGTGQVSVQAYIDGAKVSDKTVTF